MAGDRLGDEIFWLTLEYVTRNMKKVLILSEKNTKISPLQWIACQLHMSSINLAASDWSLENARPIRWRGSLALMTSLPCSDAAGIKLVNNTRVQAKRA